MDTKERAKKLAEVVMKELENYLPVEGCGTFYSEHIEDIIGTQISEAEREAYQNAISKCAVDKASYDLGRAEGFRAGQLGQKPHDHQTSQCTACMDIFRAAKEKAKGIAENYVAPRGRITNMEDSRAIAQSIEELLP